MPSLKTYIETLSNKFTVTEDEFFERDAYDAGYVEGWEEACNIILKELDKHAVISEAKDIYEILKDIRYDKNATGQFSSAKLKDEFTDYALRDISNKTWACLRERYSI